MHKIPSFFPLCPPPPHTFLWDVIYGWVGLNCRFWWPTCQLWMSTTLPTKQLQLETKLFSQKLLDRHRWKIWNHSGQLQSGCCLQYPHCWRTGGEPGLWCWKLSGCCWRKSGTLSGVFLSLCFSDSDKICYETHCIVKLNSHSCMFILFFALKWGIQRKTHEKMQKTRFWPTNLFTGQNIQHVVLVKKLINMKLQMSHRAL